MRLQDELPEELGVAQDSKSLKSVLNDGGVQRQQDRPPHQESLPDLAADVQQDLAHCVSRMQLEIQGFSRGKVLFRLFIQIKET